MYILVPYNISPIQQGIQAGHAVEQYRVKYPDDKVYEDYVKNWKTWMVMNGGTTNSNRDLDTCIAVGTLNQDLDTLSDAGIQVGTFIEPDLNDALTAVCFVCDERVFNKTDYPDFKDWLLDNTDDREEWKLIKKSKEEYVMTEYPSMYTKWVAFIGGYENLVRREVLKYKRFA